MEFVKKLISCKNAGFSKLLEKVLRHFYFWSQTRIIFLTENILRMEIETFFTYIHEVYSDIKIKKYNKNTLHCKFVKSIHLSLRSESKINNN